MAVQQQNSVEEQIRALERQFENLYHQGDAAGLAAMYSPCAEILPNEGEAVRERADFVALFERYYREAPTIQLTVREVVDFVRAADGQTGDTAYEVGDFTLLDQNGGQVDRGKYIVIWILTEAGWKLHRDIFNTSLPPAQ